jgi:hypothetical protein
MASARPPREALFLGSQLLSGVRRDVDGSVWAWLLSLSSVSEAGPSSFLLQSRLPLFGGATIVSLTCSGHTVSFPS